MYYLHNVAIVVTAVWKHFEYNKYLNFVIIATANFVGRNLVVVNSVKLPNQLKDSELTVFPSHPNNNHNPINFYQNGISHGHWHLSTILRVKLSISISLWFEGRTDNNSLKLYKTITRMKSQILSNKLYVQNYVKYTHEDFITLSDIGVRLFFVSTYLVKTPKILLLKVY